MKCESDGIQLSLQQTKNEIFSFQTPQSTRPLINNTLR